MLVYTRNLKSLSVSLKKYGLNLSLYDLIGIGNLKLRCSYLSMSATLLPRFYTSVSSVQVPFRKLEMNIFIDPSELVFINLCT